MAEFANMATFVASPVTTGDRRRPYYRKTDPGFLNSDQRGGVVFLGDMMFNPRGYSGGPPVNGATVTNLANDKASPRAPAATMVVPAGQTVNFNKGLDFAACTQPGAYLQLPAEFSAEMFASVNQYFSIAFVIKFPTEAQWFSGNTLRPFYTHTLSPNGNSSAVSLIQIGMRTSSGVKHLLVDRQTGFSGGAGQIDTNALVLPNGHPIFGSVCMPYYRRVASGQKLSVLYATSTPFTGSIAGEILTVTVAPAGQVLTTGTVIRGAGVSAGTMIVGYLTGAGGTGTYFVSREQTVASGQLTMLTPQELSTAPIAAGAPNTADFSATTPMFGIPMNRWAAADLTAGAGNFRIGRFWLENLEKSGRDPDAAAAANWRRVLARNAF